MYAVIIEDLVNIRYLNVPCEEGRGRIDDNRDYIRTINPVG